MKPVDIAVCLVTMILICYMVFGFIKSAQATQQYYNTFKLDCGTLKGSGNVSIWFNDELYHIPIECK